MTEREPPARVGVRELRQNLSVYLRRVQAGETLEVTEHGHSVARLEPLAEGRLSPIQQMILDGRARPATTDILDLEPLDLGPGRSLSEILQGMRDEEFR
jgi:prevent-host-death family protein